MKIQKEFPDRQEVEIQVGDIIQIDTEMYLLIDTFTEGYRLQSFNGSSHWGSFIKTRGRLNEVIAEAKSKHRVTIYPAANFKLQLKERK